MKLFISPNVNSPKDLLLFQELMGELRKLQVSAVSSIDVKQKRDHYEFKDVDALILDGSSQDQDIGYFMAIALAHKKPVLYLLRKGDIIDSSVEALTQNQEVKKYIRLAFYSPESLIRKVKSFLQFLDQNIGKELYTIKYTLRLSPRLDRYATWKSKQIKKNKADFIRDSMNDMMTNDAEFQSRLQ